MQILTKLDIGDDIFYMKDNKVVCEIVSQIPINVTLNMYNCKVIDIRYITHKNVVVDEKDAFGTKYDLITSL